MQSWVLIDLKDYIYTIEANPNVANYTYLDPSVVAIFQGRSGADITKEINDLVNVDDTSKTNTMNCIKTLFYLGSTDPRKTARCEIQPYLLLAFSIMIVTVIFVKVA